MRLAILASGRGSNFNAIAENILSGNCKAKIAVLITNNRDAKAIDVAKKYSIPVEIIDIKSFKNRTDYDYEIKNRLDKYSIDLVVLAGYMLIIRSKELLEKYKIINIHPSLLPSFPGINSQKQAFEYGCKISGVTIHYVDTGLDSGPIIYQEAVDISECKNIEEVESKILITEHSAYSKAINLLSKKHTIFGRRVIFD